MGGIDRKGLIFGVLAVIFVGLQPIVANARPEVLDAHIFAAMTCLIEALIFFPLMLFEIKSINSKTNPEGENEIEKTQTSVLKKWRKKINSKN